MLKIQLRQCNEILKSANDGRWKVLSFEGVHFLDSMCIVAILNLISWKIANDTYIKQVQNSWWIADAKVFLLARWRIRQIWYSQKIKSWHFQLLVAIIFELIRSMIYCDMWCLVLELAQSTEIMAWNINQVLFEWNRNQGEMVDATDVKINALSNSVHLCSCVCSCFDILFLFNRRFALVTNNVLSIIWVFWFTRAIRIWSIFFV